MNIKHLEHLLALAESGSFSRAAETLFITQSALSRSIQSLEEDLGGKVLDRIGKRNELTPLGQIVTAGARHIVRDAAELRHSAKQMQGGDMGMINIGLGSGPAALLTQPLLRMAAEQHPKLRVLVTQGPAESQLIQLRNRKLDALVVDARRVVAASDLNIDFAVELRAGFVVRNDHPLTQLETVTFTDVLQYPVASSPLSEEVSRLLTEQYGPLANPAEMVALRCDDVLSLIQTVSHSNAIFLGIFAAARNPMQEGSLVELKLTPAIKANARFAYITLAGRTEAPAMRLFREFVREMLKD